MVRDTQIPPLEPPVKDLTTSHLFGLSLTDEEWFERARVIAEQPPVGRLGPYELLAEVGRGGQGIVYRARQPGTGRDIAIKRVSAGVFASAETRARFEREIEATAALDHPHIVTVFGAEVIDGQPLLTMKWIDGVPIERWAVGPNGERRPVKKLLEVFLLVCDAVHHAHQRGVIHRDLKPSNILVDRHDQPHVLDFGLAKVERERGSTATLTLSGAFLGTPAYAAPEQFRGDARNIDVRTDVYALGAILYHLLTGRLPFGTSDDLGELIQAISLRDPPAPSALDRRLNRELDAIVLKALQKSKDRRYASVDALTADVRRYLAGEAVWAHPPSRAYRLRKFVGQHRLAVAGSTAFVLVLIGATVTSTVFYVRAAQARALADAERDRAVAAELLERRQREVAEQAVATEAEQRRQASGTTSSLEWICNAVFRLFDRSNESLDGGFPASAQDAIRWVADRSVQAGDQGLRHGQNLASLGIVASRLGLRDLALEYMTRVVEIERRERGNDDVALAVSLSNLSWMLSQLGRYDEAENAAREGLRLREDNLGTDNVYVAKLLGTLAWSQSMSGQLDEAERNYHAALELFRNHAGERTYIVATTRRGLANVLNKKGQTAEAEREFREALAVFEEVHCRQTFDALAAASDLGECLMKQGRSVEAEAIFRDTLTQQQALWGKDERGALTSALNLGWALWAQGKLAEAEPYYRQSLEGRRRVLGNEHPHTVQVMFYEGQLLTELGRPAESEPLLWEVLAARRKTLGAGHVDLVPVLIDLGRACLLNGRSEEAEPVLREAVAIARADLPADHINSGLSQGFLGEALTAQDRYEEAEPLLLESNRIIQGAARARATHKRQSLDRLVRLYDAWGRPEQATEYRVVTAP